MTKSFSALFPCSPGKWCMVVYFMVGKSTLYTGMPLPVNYDILVIIAASILDYNYTEREKEKGREGERQGEGSGRGGKTT